MINFTGTPTVVHYLTQLGNALARNNDVAIIAPEEAEFEGLGENIDIVQFPFPSSLPGAMLKTLDFSLYRHLRGQIRRLNPNVIHITFELRFPFFFAWLLHRNYPVIVTIHEPKPFSLGLLRSILVNRVQAINAKLLARVADEIIVHGEKHKRYLLAQNISSHKIEIIPHGEFSFFAQYGKGSTEAIQNSNILFFGRITPYKGINYLIEAGKLIRERIPDVTITIAGNGDFTKYGRMIGNDSSFIVLNRFIPDDEVAELFQKASIVVLPYVDGSQSGVISIAYAFKKPVVATDVGNFPEMVKNGKTGFVIPPRDANALAQSITKLLANDELREEMGRNGYKLLKEDFSWENIARKTFKVYEDAIKDRQDIRKFKGSS